MRLDLAIWEAGGHQFCDEPLGVMALREPDRRRDMAEAVILVEQPRALEIPPFDAVEQIVEPGRGERLDLIQRGPEIFGEEQDLGVDRFGGADQPAPHLGRHLVRGVAAEAAETEPGVMAHERLEIGDNLVPLRRPVVELGEIAPNGFAFGIVRVDGEGGAHRAIPVAGEPVGPALDQLAVLRGVIDDKVHDWAQPMAARRLGKAAQQSVVAPPGLTAEAGVQPVIILDRVKAAGETGVVEGINVNRVEGHGGNPRQFCGPAGDRPRQCRKQIVNPQAFAHRASSLPVCGPTARHRRGAGARQNVPPIKDSIPRSAGTRTPHFDRP